MSPDHWSLKRGCKLLWCWIISSNDFVVFAAGSGWVVLSFVMHIPCHLVILVYVTLTM